MGDNKSSVKLKDDKRSKKDRKDYSDNSSEEIDRRHRHDKKKYKDDKYNSKSRKDHKYRRRDSISNTSSSIEKDRKKKKRSDPSNEEEPISKSKSYSRRDERRPRDKHRDRKRSDESSPSLKKRDQKDKKNTDPNQSNERLKQERLARLRMLKFDEEYAGLINRQSDTEDKEKKVDKIEVEKEHQELADKLKLNPLYIAEQMKSLEANNNKENGQIVEQKEKDDKLDQDDDLLDPLEVDSLNMSFTSKRTINKQGPGEIDPLDEFMFNLEQVEQEPFQLNKYLEEYIAPPKNMTGEKAKTETFNQPVSISLYEKMNGNDNNDLSMENSNNDLDENFKNINDNSDQDNDSGSGDDLDFIKALKETDFDDPKFKQTLALNQQITELKNPELFSDLSVDDQEQLKEKNNDDYQQTGDFFAFKDKIKKKKEFETIHDTVLENEVKKNLYIESPEVAAMNEEAIEEMRKQLGDIKIRGLDPLKPVWSWYHCGLSSKIINVLVDKLGYKYPFPVQCQCIPVITSGRDCIGIAETGSGKTLAYILPMIKHIKAQRPLKEGDGPICIIMVPTRELAGQVYSTTKLLAKTVGLRVAAIYGGAGVSGQLSELKKGVEIVVCTPGRMIDTLSLSSGKITNLKRVSYVVIDEADRMFDMGFEPQLMKIISGVRLNRQIVMFSATFPKNVEALAKRILRKPLEVVVGTRGQICKNVNQSIQILDNDKKLLKLLELLGIWLERGNILIFVDRKVDADSLYTQLVQYKYKPLLLHGGQDQADREFTLKEYTTHSNQMLIATSLVARGLDIQNIVLVVNYYCPTFKEDYIHRIGKLIRKNW